MELWTESTEWYETALRIKPEYIQAINGLQRVWALRGDLEQSLAAAVRLLELADREIAYWRGELGRPDIRVEYEAELRRRIRASAASPTETHMSASTALVALKRPSEALDHLAAALELEPSRAEIFSRRAQILLSQSRTREARDDLRLFLKFSTLPVDDPDMTRAFDLLAECDATLGSDPAPATR
jgi:tetratricopeptide (TPR) repeat protein